MGFSVDFIQDVEAYIRHCQANAGMSGIGRESIPVSVRVHGEYVPEQGWHGRAEGEFNNIISVWSLVIESAELLTSEMPDKQIHLGSIIDDTTERYVIVTDHQDRGEVTLEWGGVDFFEAEQTVDREEYATEILENGEAFVEFVETEVLPYCEQNPNTLNIPHTRQNLGHFKDPVTDLADHLGREPAWRTE